MSRTLSTTRFSRHALPPAPRLRHRRDVGAAPAVLVAGALVLALWVDSALAAGPRTPALRVEESAELEVVVTVEASAAPTFQVFRLPGPPRFAVELPGLVLEGTPQTNGAGVLLLDASFEAGGKAGPARLVLSFAADVDYDAQTRAGTLEVRFSHHGDKAPLVAAAEQRKARAAEEARARETAAARVAAEMRSRAAEAERLARVAEESRLAAAAAKERAELDRLAALEKKRQEEEQRRSAAAEAKRRAEDERQLALAKKRQEEEQARLAAAEAKQQAELAKKAAIEQKRQEEEQRRVAAAEAKRRADEEKKAAIEKKRQEEEQAKQAAAEAKRRADEEKKAAIEKRRQEEEQAKQAAIEKRRQEEEQAKQAAIEKKRQEEEQVKQAALEKKRQEEEQRLRAAQEAERRAAEARRQEEEARARAEAAAKAEREREAARRADEERRLQALEAERTAQEAKAKADEAARRRAEELARSAEQARTEERARLAAPRTAVREVSTTNAAVPAEPVGFGFGGKSIDIGPPARYQRFQPSGDDEFGGGDEELDEAEGKSVLSKVTVQRTAEGSRVGVQVDGGARYDLRRRGKSQLVLTLFDTRADNLNVRRVLDARALDTSVVRVLPSVEEDVRFRVELLIELREQSPVRIGQSEGVLWLDVGNG